MEMIQDSSRMAVLLILTKQKERARKNSWCLNFHLQNQEKTRTDEHIQITCVDTAVD
jgi:hypothetical protein